MPDKLRAKKQSVMVIANSHGYERTKRKLPRHVGA